MLIKNKNDNSVDTKLIGHFLQRCRPRPGVLVVWCGGVLLSHTLSGAVPSPCQVLASGFGMGPGVSPGPWPPQILGYRPGNGGFPPACGGSGTGQWTRFVLLLTDRARVRTVLPVRLRGALPGPAPHTLAGVWMWVASRPLVPVGSTPRGASTSGLSTTCSAWGLQRLGAAWNPYLGEGFPLRCFQRLSLPNVANRPRHWRDDRHTRGSSTQVLSYYGQACRHRGAKPSRRYGLLGMISLLSPGYLLSVERCRVRTPAPDH